MGQFVLCIGSQIIPLSLSAKLSRMKLCTWAKLERLSSGTSSKDMSKLAKFFIQMKSSSLSRHSIASCSLSCPIIRFSIRHGQRSVGEINGNGGDTTCAYLAKLSTFA